LDSDAASLFTSGLSRADRNITACASLVVTASQGNAGTNATVGNTRCNGYCACNTFSIPGCHRDHS
jgi:hypothetical protein